MILLDRDGVLNELVVHPELGFIDSPLNVDQLKLYPKAIEAAADLAHMGFKLAIVTNQPGFAKGKTTRENLELIQQRVITALENAGAKIASSHICFHRAEDKCECRKPKTGLLEAAFQLDSTYDRASSWMVGDGLTDIQAGQSFKVRTAFLGPKKIEHHKVFSERGIPLPEMWCEDLSEFVTKLKGRS